MSRTYTEEQVLALMALVEARDRMGTVAQMAHRAETETLCARGFLDAMDKSTRDELRELADRATKITLEADRITSALDRIRREVQA